MDSIKNKWHDIDVADIDIAIRMLRTHLDETQIAPVLTALETLRSDTQNESYRRLVAESFNTLGILQGAVLTYAPYLNIFVSDDPFGDH